MPVPKKFTYRFMSSRPDEAPKVYKEVEFTGESLADCDQQVVVHLKQLGRLRENAWDNFSVDRVNVKEHLTPIATNRISGTRRVMSIFKAVVPPVRLTYTYRIMATRIGEFEGPRLYDDKNITALSLEKCDETAESYFRQKRSTASPAKWHKFHLVRVDVPEKTIQVAVGTI